MNANEELNKLLRRMITEHEVKPVPDLKGMTTPERNEQWELIDKKLIELEAHINGIASQLDLYCMEMFDIIAELDERGDMTPIVNKLSTIQKGIMGIIHGGE